MRIGTDCSGIEAPIQALNKLGIDYEHIFSSDINKYVRESIKANYSPNVLFEDMTIDRKLPNIDVYVCGFPCQPFSTAGNRLGSEDPRGNIFFQCIKTIKQTKPVIFILENVRGIMTVQNGTYFKEIKRILGELEDYEIDYSLMNTKHYGIPQNRERLFMTGILKISQKKKFEIPKKIKCKPIDTFINTEYNQIEKYSNTYKNVYNQFKNGTFVTIGSLYSENNNKNKVDPGHSSTIIASCALWCIPMHRKATIGECLSLQGFPKDFKQVVSDTQMRRQIGNSMSVNVLEHLFTELFKCVDIKFVDQ